MLVAFRTMRRRSPSYSPPRRRGRYPSPRRRHPLRRDPSTSLLVRNLHKSCRAEDLRGPFVRFGPIRDIYLPRDYYTGEPRGFGFVQYLDPADAEDAQYQMNHYILHGHEITVVFAEENRKHPTEMRSKERLRGHSSGHDRRYRSPYNGWSRSRSPRHRSPTPKRRYHSRSPSVEKVRERERSYSGSPVRSPSPNRHLQKGRHVQHFSESDRSSPDRDAQGKLSGKADQLRFSKSLPRSPSLPPRRRRSSQSRNELSRTPGED